MEDSIQKFLEFNGTSIYFLSKNGHYYVALKPICEALGVNWNRQYQNVKADEILGAEYAVQQMQVDEKQSREYLCLPEFYVYGWLFQINSESPKLKEYKWKCYELLYNYFHGTIAKRISTLKSKRDLHEEIAELTRTLNESEEGQRIAELKKSLAGTTRELKELDSELTETQIKLF